MKPHIHPPSFSPRLKQAALCQSGPGAGGNIAIEFRSGQRFTSHQL